jgi:hypothetical protein
MSNDEPIVMKIINDYLAAGYDLDEIDPSDVAESIAAYYESLGQVCDPVRREWAKQNAIPKIRWLLDSFIQDSLQ